LKNKDEYLKKIKPLLETIKKLDVEKYSFGDKTNNPILYIQIAEIELNKSSYYVNICLMSDNMLGVKSVLYSDNARKCIIKALSYYEKAVTNYVDVPFSDYKDKIVYINKIPYKKKNKLIRKLGFAIDVVEGITKENTLQKWAFVDIWKRYAVIIKNMLDLKIAAKNDIRLDDYKEIKYHTDLVITKLNEAADKLMTKYHVSTHSIDDIQNAITLISVLIRIQTLLNNRQHVDELKRKIGAWKRILNREFKG